MDKAYNMQDIESQIKPVGSREQNMVILVYGEHGIGKTTLAATAPGPILFLNFEPRGDDSLYGNPNAKKIDVLDWSKLEPVYGYLMNRGKEQFKTIVLDTLSELQELAIRKTVGKTGFTDRSKLITAESNPMQLQNWGDIGRLMTETIRKFILLSDRYHVVLLGQLKMQTDERGNKYLGPDLSPASIKPAERLVSIIGQLEPDHEIVYDETGRVVDRKFRNRLTIIPTGDAEGKDRTSGLWVPKEQRLGSVIVNPNLSKMIDIYTGNKTSK